MFKVFLILNIFINKMTFKIQFKTSYIKWNIQFKQFNILKPLIVTQYKHVDKKLNQLFIDNGFMMFQFSLIKRQQKPTYIIINHIISSMNNLITQYKHHIDLTNLFFVLFNSNYVTLKLLYNSLFNDKQLYKIKKIFVIDTPYFNMSDNIIFIKYHKKKLIQQNNLYLIYHKKEIPLILLGYIDEPFTCLPCKQKRYYLYIKNLIIKFVYTFILLFIIYILFKY